GGLVRATGGAERREQRMAPLPVTGALEELGVLRVGARPTALDEGDPELVQALRDPELVHHRVGDAFTLAAVAQGGVVNRDPAHVSITRLRHILRLHRVIRSHRALRRAGPPHPAAGAWRRGSRAAG